MQGSRASDVLDSRDLKSKITNNKFRVDVNKICGKGKFRVLYTQQFRLQNEATGYEGAKIKAPVPDEY